MKVLFDGRILRQSVVTGVQRYGREILKAFNARGLNPDVAYPSTENPVLNHLWEHTALPLKSRGYDILFCPGNVAPFWNPSRAGIVTVLHSISYKLASWSYSRAFRLYYDILIPRAVSISSAVITVSDSEKEILKRHFPEHAGKIFAVQNGISDVFHEQKIDNNKQEYILYVGSLNPLKNLNRVIEAFTAIQDKIPHKLMIVGPDHHVFGKTASASGERIVFARHTADDNYLAGLYSKASLFVFPSLYEASPLPPSEAMACGCPVLVSDIPALRERCGGAAAYCNPNDTRDIADKMLALLKDNSARAALSEKGKEFSRKYTWDAAAARTIELFGQVHDNSK